MDTDSETNSPGMSQNLKQSHIYKFLYMENDHKATQKLERNV